jgi:hypothetical protein
MFLFLSQLSLIMGIPERERERERERLNSVVWNKIPSSPFVYLKIATGGTGILVTSISLL